MHRVALVNYPTLQNPRTIGRISDSQLLVASDEPLDDNSYWLEADLLYSIPINAMAGSNAFAGTALPVAIPHPQPPAVADVNWMPVTIRVVAALPVGADATVLILLAEWINPGSPHGPDYPPIDASLWCYIVLRHSGTAMYYGSPQLLLQEYFDVAGTQTDVNGAPVYWIRTFGPSIGWDHFEVQGDLLVGTAQHPGPYNVDDIIGPVAVGVYGGNEVDIRSMGNAAVLVASALSSPVVVPITPGESNPPPLPAPTPSTLTDAQLAGLAASVGFTGRDIVLAVAMALAESDGRTDATNANANGSTDYGLWQINTIHPELLASGTWSVPADNARMAYSVFTDAGRSWTPWSTYNNGAYLKFYARGQTAAANPDTTYASTAAATPRAVTSAGTGTGLDNTASWGKVCVDVVRVNGVYLLLTVQAGAGLMLVRTDGTTRLTTMLDPQVYPNPIEALDLANNPGLGAQAETYVLSNGHGLILDGQLARYDMSPYGGYIHVWREWIHTSADGAQTRDVELIAVAASGLLSGEATVVDRMTVSSRPYPEPVIDIS
jgi:hypothetical protein